MILCDTDLIRMMYYDGLIQEPDYSLVNPASIDVRVGMNAIIEDGPGVFRKMVIPSDRGLTLPAGAFVLIDTWECLYVPNGYAVELRLKSSTARKGFDHNAALWVDPGWRGVLTMEVRNVLRYTELTLVPGSRFAQVIVHKLSGLSQNPYQGRYNDAKMVEGPKT